MTMRRSTVPLGIISRINNNAINFQEEKMKASKNTLALLLMTSSVVLLVVLQLLWLKSSYEKAFFDFRRESSMLFRSAVFNLRDSLFVQNVEPLRGDSLAAVLRPDPLNVQFLERGRDSSNVRIFIST